MTWLSVWIIFALLISFFILYFERPNFVRIKQALVYLPMFFAEVWHYRPIGLLNLDNNGF